jgi:ribonuclease R
VYVHPLFSEAVIAKHKKQLLTLLSQKPQSRFTLKQLAKHIKVKTSEEYHELRLLIEDLGARGLIAADEDGKIGYKSERTRAKQTKPSRIIGKLSVNKRGFGFVRIDGTDEEIFIGPKSMKTALHGDIVEVVPFAQPMKNRKTKDDDRTEGEIIHIIERTRTTIVGTLEQNARFSFVIPDDERFTRDIYIAREDLKGATHGEKVVVELLAWDDEQQNPEGTVIETLGTSGDARVEVLGVARSFDLPLEFPKDVEREAAHISDVISQADIDERLDLRGILCFTIDPEDAKDFDDAVSWEELQDGTTRLGVHIADVSHYVRQDSVLDREALARGTSVYMVNEVIPMLPERLSNNLCSLRPDVDRLTYSVLMNVTPTGIVENYIIRKSIIHSSRRFTYEEVQKILESGKGEFSDTLLPLFRFTQALIKRRRRDGSIDFDTGEAKFAFDEKGFPSRIIRKERLDAHRLIEECMLLANKIVAQHIGKVKKEEHAKPFVYRVHDVPDPSRLNDLAHFVKQFGFSLDVRTGVSSKSLQRLLDQIKGSEVENFINEVALRSMAKAIYSEKNIGHYGLAFDYYTHFTSPIRRYPDLEVHRLLYRYERGTSSEDHQELARRLQAVCRQSSDRERLAAEAERASVKVMQVEYMKRHVGDEFEGVIGGVTQYGLFIEISDLLVEGLVHVRDLSDDYYLYDEKHYTLRGRTHGRTFRLGDKVRVKVVSVTPEKREIDFAIVK